MAVAAIETSRRAAALQAAPRRGRRRHPNLLPLELGLAARQPSSSPARHHDGGAGHQPLRCVQHTGKCLRAPRKPAPKPEKSMRLSSFARGSTLDLISAVVPPALHHSHR